MKWKNILVVGAAALLVLLSVILIRNQKQTDDEKITQATPVDSVIKNNTADSHNVQPVAVDSSIAIPALTHQILTALKNKDYKTFSRFIHPVLGVRFSPYAYVDTTKNVVLTADDFLKKINTGTKINWGNYDGSGEPILLTTEEYLKKFVYSADFVNADTTVVNKTIGRGNSLNNLQAVYKGCNYTESYFAGFDKKLEGMDWAALRLVYKNYRGKNYLVAVIHDQWTI